MLAHLAASFSVHSNQMAQWKKQSPVYPWDTKRGMVTIDMMKAKFKGGYQSIRFLRAWRPSMNSRQYPILL
ncbi:hypothetical protein [Desulfocurvibacter africanus]|uniref:hypothetical protein n=1 Tax=Desulfocurvibacter africanus TaxID=873 RepID=UPI0004850BD9|nr:hypothetical protein [Desulfocurvibacter africanus]